MPESRQINFHQRWCAHHQLCKFTGKSVVFIRVMHRHVLHGVCVSMCLNSGQSLNSALTRHSSAMLHSCSKIHFPSSSSQRINKPAVEVASGNQRCSQVGNQEWRSIFLIPPNRSVLQALLPSVKGSRIWCHSGCLLFQKVWLCTLLAPPELTSSEQMSSG